MASNHFGQLFKITTWGESHGKAIGVVIDGCPAGLSLNDNDINHELAKRAPGNNPFTSPRKEPDRAQILSGIFDGKTTGTPIAIMIVNQDADPSKYEPIKQLMRPGHANFTYIEKYGHFDHRGGGRASARETACRVAAAAVAKKMLALQNIKLLCYVKSIGEFEISDRHFNKKHLTQSPIFCPDPTIEPMILLALEQAKQQGDSLGACVECIVTDLPIGLGDPVYEKLEANLAKAMMSLPATKGFEIGEGFNATRMTGSMHNDAFIGLKGQVTASNHAGGTLGGISNGMPIIFRVAFKPTSSINKIQHTVDIHGKPQTLQLPKGSRHDPCVGIRAVPIVEAMCALVLADAILLNRCAKI